MCTAPLAAGNWERRGRSEAGSSPQPSCCQPSRSKGKAPLETDARTVVGSLREGEVPGSGGGWATSLDIKQGSNEHLANESPSWLTWEQGSWGESK